MSGLSIGGRQLSSTTPVVENNVLTDEPDDSNDVDKSDSTLKSLTIGSLTLSPKFDSAVTEYTVVTTNNSNAVTAVANDENAEIEISRGIATVDNGTRVTWSEGENVVTITVTNGDSTTTYTVTVTK